MQKTLSIRNASVGVVAGLLLFWSLDKIFGLTAGAFHHIFGTGILFSYLLAPLVVSYVTGFLSGPYGKFLGAIPTMGYLLVTYLVEIMHPSGQAVGIPVAPFMMIFFITVPEVSFVGGYVGEVVRRRRESRKSKAGNSAPRGRQRVS